MSNAPAIPSDSEDASPRGLGASQSPANTLGVTCDAGTSVSGEHLDEPGADLRSDGPDNPAVSGQSAPKAHVATADNLPTSPIGNGGNLPVAPPVSALCPQRLHAGAALPLNSLLGVRASQGNLMVSDRSKLPSDGGSSSKAVPAAGSLSSRIVGVSDSNGQLVSPGEVQAVKSTLRAAVSPPSTANLAEATSDLDSPVSEPASAPLPPSAAVKQRGTKVSPEPLSPDTIHWEVDHPGLGRRSRNGRSITWIVQFRVGSHTVRRTLGKVEEYSPEQAWVAAKLLRKKIVIAPRPSTNSNGVTLREFAARFLRERRQYWKPTTAKENLKQVRRLVAKPIGAQLVSQLNRAAIAEWRAGPEGRCNRGLSLLSQMCLHAEDVGMRPRGTNPCSGLARKKTSFEAKYPQREDYAAIGSRIRALEADQPVAVALLRFLALTGTRRAQALNLKRCHVDGTRAILPDSKNGPCTIFLPMPVQQLIALQPRGRPNGYVFGRGSRSMLDNKLTAIWKEVRRPLGLRGMRVHDLRHGYASVGVGAGEDLRVVGCLLGHKDANTTAGYAHLAERPIAEAAQRVSSGISISLDAALGQKPSRAPKH